MTDNNYQRSKSFSVLLTTTGYTLPKAIEILDERTKTFFETSALYGELCSIVSIKDSVIEDPRPDYNSCLERIILYS